MKVDPKLKNPDLHLLSGKTISTEYLGGQKILVKNPASGCGEDI